MVSAPCTSTSRARRSALVRAGASRGTLGGSRPSRQQHGCGVRVIFDAAHASTRDADDRRHTLHIFEHDGSGTDDRFAAEGNLGNDGGADADEGAGFYLDPSGESRSGADVGSFANHRVMIDDAAGVEDNRVADLAVRADDDPGADDNVVADEDTLSEGRGGVNRVDQLEIGGADLACEGAADAVVADRDDRSLDFLLSSDLRQLIDRTQNRTAVDASADEVWVSIEEADNVAAAVLGEDVEHDSPVAAGSEDQGAC